MSLVQDIINALIALETSGTSTIGPETNTNTFTLFNQKIQVEEAVTVNLKKM